MDAGRIRPATEDDLDAIRAIYNYEVMNGVATFDLVPRTAEDQLRWFREHAPPYSAIVLEDAGSIRGYGCLSRYREKPAYDLTVEDTVYVHHDYRRRGAGKALVLALLDGARRGSFHTVIGRITGENEASIELHRTLGFEDVGREREVGRKFDRWLDVVTMQYVIGG
jgi:L-amino acid N-acyltransferase YncA